MRARRQSWLRSLAAAELCRRCRLVGRCASEGARIGRVRHPRPAPSEWPVVGAPSVGPNRVGPQATMPANRPGRRRWPWILVCRQVRARAGERSWPASGVTMLRALEPGIWASTRTQGAGVAKRCLPARAAGRRTALADSDGENATDKVGEKFRLRGQLRARVVARSHHGLPGEGPWTSLRRIQGLPCELPVRFAFLIPVSDTELGVGLALMARHSCPQRRPANGFMAPRTHDLKSVVTIRSAGASRVRRSCRHPGPSERAKRAGRAGAHDACPSLSGGA